MEGIAEKLQRIWLTGNESRVYAELLRKGELSANNLAKKISMDRTLAYTVLNHLIEKGLVSYVIRQNKKYFSAADPSNLLNPVREREAFVKSLIPELRSIEKEIEAPQEINIYEGKEALRNVFNLLKRHKEILSFGATGRAYDYLYESPALTKELVKIGMKGKIITSKKHSEHPMTKVKNIKIRYVDYDSEATTSIFGDYVMIHIAKEKPIVILIKNKQVSDTYRKHFEALWKISRD